MPEWLKGTVLKTVEPAMVPRVRISLSPPNKNTVPRTVFLFGESADRTLGRHEVARPRVRRSAAQFWKSLLLSEQASEEASLLAISLDCVNVEVFSRPSGNREVLADRYLLLDLSHKKRATISDSLA